MPNKRTLTSLVDLAYDQLTKHGLFRIDMPDDTPSERQHAALCLVEEIAIHKLFQALLQAVVDENDNIVLEILELNPQLLLLKAKKGVVIQSQYTWIKYDLENESALSITVKRKQNKILRLLLSFYDRLHQTEEVLDFKSQALAAWNSYAIKKNDMNEDVLVIPDDYALYAQYLVDIIQQDPVENGYLTEQTEASLTLLFNLLIPKSPIKLEECIDPALFLHALNVVYDEAYLLNAKQRNVFTTRVMGLVGSTLLPDTAKMVCQGLYHVLVKNLPVGQKGQSLMLSPTQPFYRSSRQSQSGLGFDYAFYLWDHVTYSSWIWKLFCINKDRDFYELNEEPCLIYKSCGVVP